MNKNQLVLNDLTWRTQARFSPAKYQFAQSNEDLHRLHLGFPPHCDSQHRWPFTSRSPCLVIFHFRPRGGYRGRAKGAMAPAHYSQLANPQKEDFLRKFNMTLQKMCPSTEIKTGFLIHIFFCPPSLKNSVAAPSWFCIYVSLVKDFIISEVHFNPYSLVAKLHRDLIWAASQLKAGVVVIPFKKDGRGMVWHQLFRIWLWRHRL